MKTLLSGAVLSAVLLLVATTARAESVRMASTNSCAIPAGDVECVDAAPQYDIGCSVTCSGSQTPTCTDASVFQIPDQYGRMSDCQLTPSSCFCD